MRFRSLTIALLSFGALIPVITYAQGSSFFGPIIPQGGNICTCPGSAPDWGCILNVLQNVINFGVSFSIVLITLALVYAGFLFMTRGSSAEARQQARNVVTNSIVGLVVILCAWLVVDFVMKAIYDPEATFAGEKIGPWEKIWSPEDGDEDMCLRPSNAKPITHGIAEIQLAVLRNTLVGGTGSCSPGEVQAAAASGGATMPGEEAAVIACMAGPESSCGANMKNYNWGKGSSAYGHFQILLDTHSDCFVNSACRQAAGLPAGQKLNCAAGFSGGNPIEGSPVVAQCQRAASNLICSAVAAHCVYFKQGASAWSGNKDSTAAHRACAIKAGS
ncbi:MAG TPA: hypothetical protein VGB97_02775 [Candidatus Paceibacterota bacterium]|jgi:hypothetical protein